MNTVLNSNPALMNWQEVREICKPLLHTFGISFFRYLKVFKDGARIHLCTNPAWTEHFYHHKFYNVAWLDYANLSEIKKGQIIWDDKAIRDDNQVGIDARNHFGIYHGVSIVRPGAHFYEVFDFATEKGNSDINEVYLSNLDIFEKFFFYFRDKAQSIIKKAEKHPIKPEDLIIQPVDSNKHLFSDFIKQIDIKRYFMPSLFGELVYLTKREAECIYWALHGKSAEEISQIITSTKRTVELHINNAKQKLGCHKIIQVFKLAINAGLLEAFSDNE